MLKNLLSRILSVHLQLHSSNLLLAPRSTVQYSWLCLSVECDPSLIITITQVSTPALLSHTLSRYWASIGVSACDKNVPCKMVANLYCMICLLLSLKYCKVDKWWPSISRVWPVAQCRTYHKGLFGPPPNPYTFSRAATLYCGLHCHTWCMMVIPTL